MNYRQIVNKLELAGWYRLNLSDDYEYFLAGTIDNDGEEENAVKAKIRAKIMSLIDSMFDSKTSEQTADYILDNKEALQAEIASDTAALARKKGVRRHLSKEERSVERFTHGAIGNDANYVCYALEPHEKLDPTDFNNLGFLKHVLFLEIKGSVVGKSWAHFATGSSSDEKDLVETFLRRELGLKKHINTYHPYFVPVSLDEVEPKLEKAGWRELDINDDYEYQLTMYPEWYVCDEEKRRKQEKISSAFSAIYSVCHFQNWYLIEKSAEQRKKYGSVEESEKSWKYVRTHLDEKSKTVERFTEGQIKNCSVHKCFALPSDVEPDLTDPGKCGFIKHVLFLKIEGDEVIDYFLHFSIQSTEEQQRFISRSLKEIGLFYTLPEKWPVPDELNEIAEDMEDCF